MSDPAIEPLGSDTWDAFGRLMERHNGVFGGCGARGSTPSTATEPRPPKGNRAFKQRLVVEGRAHAALVMDGGEAVAWCQYGSPAELPNI